MKTLVIINGVTGALGTACLAEYSRERDVTIYGLSRKAKPFSFFLHNAFLPDKTLICSIGDITNATCCQNFFQAVNTSLYEKIVYIHAVGIYPFEINPEGNIHVAYDEDRDGIDDRVMKLTHDAFFSITDCLKKSEKTFYALLFGGLADKQRTDVHQSWWKTIEIVKKQMNEDADHHKNAHFIILNISSVICPNELITRPFVFQHTDADPRFWLMPNEVAQKVASLTSESLGKRFIEEDFYHDADYYTDDYFTEEKFTNRKKAELGIQASSDTQSSK